MSTIASIDLGNGQPSLALLPAQALRTVAAHGVTFRPGARFITGEGFANTVRLSFAHYGADTLLEGVRRLAQAMEAYLADAALSHR